MPFVGRRPYTLSQHSSRAVLAALHLVADHGKLGLEVFVSDMGIDHTVGFHAQGPLQVVLGGLEALEVIGAVEPGRAVEPHASLIESLGDVGVIRRSLEQQVLQKVRHAGFAVVLVHGADVVGYVHGHARLGAVGKQQHLQTVRQ